MERKTIRNDAGETCIVFSLPSKGVELTLRVKDYTSGAAMLEAATAWAAKQ